MTPAPLAHQASAIEQIIEQDSLLVEYGTGCIAGNTEISINRAGKGWTLQLDALVRLFNGGVADPEKTGRGQNGARWNLDIPTYVQREQDGVVRLALLTGAWCSGIKQTYLVTTESGRTIRATAEHPFLTERGWLRLEELEAGDLVHVRGQQALNGRRPKMRYTDIYRMHAHPFARYRKNGSASIERHRLVVEARANGLTYDEFVKRIRERRIAGLTFHDPKRFHVHHKDRNTRNDEPDNLELHTGREHLRLHAEAGNYKNVLFKIEHERVVSIEAYGEEMTYDLEVADSPHNFLANGFVVHNTGKTRVIVEVCKILVAAGDVPILVTVPNSLIEQTISQFIQWAGRSWTLKHLDILDSSLTIYQRREKLKRGNGSVMLIAHEALSYALIREGIRSRRWGAALVDEASRFRNYSKRTVTLRAMGKQARTRYAFTGNLTVRNPADSWYVMNFLEPGVFGTTDRDTFITEYCLLGGYTGRSPIAVRPDKLETLTAILDRKRIKAELRDIRDLPERTLLVRHVDLAGAQRRAYHQMREELRAEILSTTDEEFETHASTYAVRLLRLQEIAAGFARNADGEVIYLPSPKTDELIETLLADPDTPTVIWYWWRPEQTVIASALAKHAIPFVTFGYDKHTVESFMAGHVNVFVSQLGRGAYGLNLTRAERMLYHSLPWDLDAYVQSQERNMRLDTTATSLTIEHFVVRGTVDEYVRSRLIDKAAMSRRLSRSQALEMLT